MGDGEGGKQVGRRERDSRPTYLPAGEESLWCWHNVTAVSLQTVGDASMSLAGTINATGH